MKISISCKCGASLDVESEATINSKGTPDRLGHVFRVERIAHEWLERHEICIPEKPEPEPDEPEEPLPT